MATDGFKKTRYSFDPLGSKDSRTLQSVSVDSKPPRTYLAKTGTKEGLVGKSKASFCPAGCPACSALGLPAGAAEDGRVPHGRPWSRQLDRAAMLRASSERVLHY